MANSCKQIREDSIIIMDRYQLLMNAKL